MTTRPNPALKSMYLRLLAGQKSPLPAEVPSSSGRHASQSWGKLGRLPRFQLENQTLKGVRREERASSCGTHPGAHPHGLSQPSLPLKDPSSDTIPPAARPPTCGFWGVETTSGCLSISRRGESACRSPGDPPCVHTVSPTVPFPFPLNADFHLILCCVYILLHVPRGFREIWTFNKSKKINQSTCKCSLAQNIHL